jgi:hypothetical protein
VILLVGRLGEWHGHRVDHRLFVSTLDDQAVAAGLSVDVGRWNTEADRLLDRMAARFPRIETRRRVRGFMFGLLADLPRTAGRSPSTPARPTAWHAVPARPGQLGRPAPGVGKQVNLGAQPATGTAQTLPINPCRRRRILVIRPSPLCGPRAVTKLPVAGARWPTRCRCFGYVSGMT